MDQRGWVIPEKAYSLFLYLGVVIASIGLTSLLARPVESALVPDKLSPSVRVGGMTLGELSEEESRQRLSLLLQAAMEKPIHLTYADRSWTVTPDQLALTYDLEGTYRDLIDKSRQSQGIRKWWHEWLGESLDPAVELHYSWNRKTAQQLLEQIKKEIDQEPANAALRIAGEQVQVVSHKTGRTLSVEESLKRMEHSLAVLQPERQVPLAVVETEPEVVTAKLEQIDTLLAGASTEIPDGMSIARKNMEQVAARLDGRILEKNALLSFQKEIGPFLSNSPYVIQADPRSLHESGGIQSGIGQAASTLYWAALKANLGIVERHAHLQPQSYITAGLDAAIWDGKLDLKVENPFDHPVYIEAGITGDRLTIRLFGNKQDRKNSEIVVEKVETFHPETVFLIDGSMETGERRVAQAGRDGVFAQIYRIVKSDSLSMQERKELVSKDYYRPMSKVVYIGPPAQILKQNDRDMALYGPASQSTAEVPGVGESFANDPNMVQPADIPPDIAGDPNVVFPSP
jgi:vancomycin resistance protein YoaR